ncbi:17661_t:CDS:1, partial [Entrophospora sp. SA101]
MSLIESDNKVLINTRAGGVYIPPARLRQLQQTITDKSSQEYQRITWEALKKSINGLINKVGKKKVDPLPVRSKL